MAKGKKLELEILEVKDVQFGSETAFSQGVLTICKQDLLDCIADEKFASLDAELAHPGSSVRIIPVKDVIEPRAKVDSGEFFPGVLGNFESVGEGKTKVLRGCAVVTTGQIVCFQEGLIDMCGPVAEYCHYSQLQNVVLVADPVEGIEPAEHEKAIRLAGLKAARYLAQCVKDVQPDKVEEYCLEELEKPLPKIAFVNLILAQGLLHDNYIYGQNARVLHTMYFHPNELLDGAIVSGNCVSACDKNTTFDHLNNPVVKDLYQRHGKDVDFVGVIASPISPILKDKERCAMGVVNLASLLDVDGLVIAEEGGGNPETDLMMICQQAEKAGIATVLMVHENAGKAGTSQGITNVTPEATAVVSVGNINEPICLPVVERVIGHASALHNLSGTVETQPDGTSITNLAIIMDAASNLGITKLRATYY